MLELYFQKNWSLPDHIVMIPEEQAAIVTFSDPKGSIFNFTTDVLMTQCYLSSSQLAFQFIHKVLDRVQVQALCRPVKFFHTKLGKAFLYGAGFVNRDSVFISFLFQQDKLLTQSWTNTIV